MKIIELALLQEPCFTTGHGSVAFRQGGCSRWYKTANPSEAAVLVSSGLDHIHEGFSTSRPNSLCAGLYSVLT